MEIYTIGFTKKTAEEFFNLLKRAEIKQLIDIRLNNSSQLAGFTKKEDIPYLLKEICGARYIHEPLLAPTQSILDSYKKKKGTWEEYEHQFLNLMAERKIEEKLNKGLFEVKSVFLCSEHTAAYCHRRLVAEYLCKKWDNVNIVHL